MLVVVGGCGRERPEAHNPLSAPPVDSARVGSVEQVAGWAYRREVGADLDGDRTPERVVLASDVTLGPDGRALWEDGHRWALYVESAGRRTMLYSAFVPNGHVEAAVLDPDDTGRRSVLVQERSPDQVRALEVEYRAPGEARSSSSAYYQVEKWIPGPASLP
ncbi:MAG TPA: hypothetical protein VF613_02860 [Longimicrobium sp.]